MSATTDPDARKAFIDSLRQLARFLASHPSAPVPMYGANIGLSTHGTDEEERRTVDEFASLLGAEITDDWDETGHYTATRAFGLIKYRIAAISEARMADYYAEQAHLAEMRRTGPASLDESAKAA